ncbi:MAG: ZIP family metal transporter [Thermofilaceae archaeon]
MFRKRLAHLVSLATAPQLYGGFIIALVWWRLGVGGLEALAVMLLAHTFLPLAPIVVGAARGEVDIFVTEREKRWKYYLFSIISYIIGIVYSLLRGYRIYAVITASYMLSAIVLAIVTVLAKWKISVHAAGIAGPTTALAMVVGEEAVPLYLLLVPVSWARLELNAHTPSQLAAGALVALLSTLLVFSLTGAGFHVGSVEGFLASILDFLESSPLVIRALVIGMVPAAMTAIGSIPVLLGARMSERASDAGLGFAAGVMLVASFTSLLLPAIEAGGPLLATLGFVAGAGLIKVVDSTLPHLHIMKGAEGPPRPLAKGLLIALAMIIHNIPEGMAVGVASSVSVHEGLLLALAIGLQNVPEGLAVALPLTDRGRLKAFLIGVASGLAEVLAAPLPALIVEHVGFTLPFLMAFAAGAMVYVVVHEMAPEIYGHEHDEPSTFGFLSGFVVMLLLDTVFGG